MPQSNGQFRVLFVEDSYQDIALVHSMLAESRLVIADVKSDYDWATYAMSGQLPEDIKSYDLCVLDICMERSVSQDDGFGLFVESVGRKMPFIVFSSLEPNTPFGADWESSGAGRDSVAFWAYRHGCIRYIHKHLSRESLSGPSFESSRLLAEAIMGCYWAWKAHRE